jgi:hypothetical protein
MVGSEVRENKMGLDQYMYVASKLGTDFDDSSRRELGYRRKHPNLHGWMHQLWENKGRPNGHPEDQFNGTELELTWNDLEELEQDIVNKRLPATSGFFFGNNSDDHYQEQDLAFVRNAKAELFLGLKVFYNSSW